MEKLNLIEKTTAKLKSILPKMGEYEKAKIELGNSVELILSSTEDFHIEDNSMTTMQLDATIVPHTVQLPVVKYRKKRRNKKSDTI
jgi:ribosomal protein L21